MFTCASTLEVETKSLSQSRVEHRPLQPLDEFNLLKGERFNLVEKVFKFGTRFHTKHSGKFNVTGESWIPGGQSMAEKMGKEVKELLRIIAMK